MGREVSSVDSRIEHVTVYASGARVRRVTTIPAPLPPRVRISGLPLAMLDDTVRVEVGGPAVAISVRVGVDAPATGDAASEQPAEVQGARRRLALAEAEVERIADALEVVSAAVVIAEDPSDEPRPPWGAVVTARKSIVALHGERELALREELAAAQKSADEAKRTLDAARDRDVRTGSARPARLHELRKYVELEIVATAASEIVIHVEYQVAAARWAPSYVARIDGDNVKVEIRAVVAQSAGEDWLGVPLRLSTAEPERFAMLPELAAQRIGRRQQEPAKPGFRAPPIGATALYADYERALRPNERKEGGARPFSQNSQFEDSTYEGKRPEAAPSMDAVDLDGAPPPSNQVWDEESSRAKERFTTPPKGFPMQSAPLAPQAAGGAFAPAPARSAPVVRARTARLESSIEHAAPALPGSPPPLVARLDYGNLMMASMSSAQRGTLVPVSLDRHAIAIAIASELAATQSKLASLKLPPGCVVDWVHTYDYAYATDGAVDVRSDGGWHSIAVTTRASGAKVRHVAVPREQPDVFRVVAISNPFTGPMLPGPIDIYDRGRFLVTSEVDYAPPGATVEIGLGVDAAVKIARNTEFREEATGMLRGALRLLHAITIDIDNVSGRAIDLEVRERVPVSREGDDDVEIIVGKVDPAWERWTPDPGAPRDQRLRGGHRWRLSVPAGQKRTLRAAYEVKIAGKLELVGGNRRES